MIHFLLNRLKNGLEFYQNLIGNGFRTTRTAKLNTARQFLWKWHFSAGPQCSVGMATVCIYFVPYRESVRCKNVNCKCILCAVLCAIQWKCTLQCKHGTDTCLKPVVLLNHWQCLMKMSGYSECGIVIQGYFLELKFFFLLFLRIVKAYRSLVTLNISLTSFHFRIYKIMTKRKILKYVFSAAIWCSIFWDFL